jgi:cephalosporin hydroxylase
MNTASMPFPHRAYALHTRGGDENRKCVSEFEKYHGTDFPIDQNNKKHLTQNV